MEASHSSDDVLTSSVPVNRHPSWILLLKSRKHQSGRWVLLACQEQPQGARQFMSRQGRTSGLALGFLLVAALLAGCNAGSTASTRASPSSTPAGTQPTTASTPIPTTIAHGEWQTFTDLQFGFSLDVPTAFSLYVLRQWGREDDFLWNYNSSNGSLPPDQAALSQAQIQIFAADGTNKPSSTSLLPAGPYHCTSGTPLTIGSGITAYQQETFTYPTPTPGQGGATGGPSISVNLEKGGVYLNISLNGHPPSETFLTRYGASWQHILNSFVPGPAAPSGHPCG